MKKLLVITSAILIMTLALTVFCYIWAFTSGTPLYGAIFGLLAGYNSGLMLFESSLLLRIILELKSKGE